MTVKITDPTLPALAMRKIMGYPDFHEVAQLVGRNTSGKVYMVGGKLYRTIIELVHGYKCGAIEADWDFLCIGDVVQKHRVFTLNGWSPDISPYEDYKANSLCLKYYPAPSPTNIGLHHLSGALPYYMSMPPLTTGFVNKVDIIGIRDVTKCSTLGNLSDYMKAVPLTVQAIALSTDNSSYPALYGDDALHSIEMKTVYINNEKGTLRPFDVSEYAMKKASSLGFKYNGYGVARKAPCDCFDGDTKAIFWRGCQRKDIHV